MDKIRLELTVDEANMILAALGQQPYLKVAALIQKIQSQGAAQVQGVAPHETSVTQSIVKESLASKNGK